jgi:hypothetical protein
MIISGGELTEYMNRVKEAAKKAHQWIAQQSDEPIQFLRNIKFEKKGYHPITGEALNLIEQVNQTWTYVVALKATEYLLRRHPEAHGFLLAPGAIASQELDIMSIRPGVVGAETFAATSPGSNGKLLKDLAKLNRKEEAYLHRYVFFAAPTHPDTKQLKSYEARFPNIEVWSLSV